MMAPAPKGSLKIQVGLRTIKAGGQVVTDLCRAYLLCTGIDLVKCQGAHTEEVIAEAVMDWLTKSGMLMKGI